MSLLKNKLNRSAINVDPNELVIFLEDCRTINDEIDKQFIYNLDVTFWKICDTNSRLIGYANSDSRKLHVNIDPRADLQQY